MSRVFSDPFFWVTLSAIFFGASLARATRRVPKSLVRERARSIKWTLVTVYLSIAIVFSLCAVFIPGPEKILDIRIVYLFSVVSVVFFLVLRFRKAIGAPLLILSFIAVLSLMLFLQAFSSFTGEREIASVRVLEAANDTMKLEVTRNERETVIVSLKGEYFAPIVKEVIFDDWYVFLGAKTWYRFEGVTAFSFVKEGSKRVLKQTDTGYYFPFPTGISERLYGYYEKYESYIPGVKTVQIDISAKRARKMATYSLLLQNDGGIQIVER